MSDYEHFGEYQSGERSSVGTALTFLLIGLGVGALSALLFAPKSGKQMRRMIKRKYEDAREVVDDWTDQAGSVIEKGGEWANTAKEKGGEWANAAKEKVAPIARAARNIKG